MKYLIDSNILIDYLRGDDKIADFLHQIEKTQTQICISVITEYELLCGVNIKFPEKILKIEQLLSLLPSFDVNSDIVQTAASFFRKYKTDIADSLIAATSIQTNSVLITRNLKHFQNIKEIKVQSV